MNRNQTITILAIIAFSFLINGCADPEPAASLPTPKDEFANMPTIEGGLVFDSVLQRSDVEMFPTFADMNSDSKPDLILGTVRNVTVQLNESTNGKLSFGNAEKPKRSHSDFDIPWG